MADNWAPIITFISVNIGLFAGLTTVVVWVVNKLDADVKSIGTRIDAYDRRFENHAQRIDQLYKMFCDLQTELKQLHIDFISKDKQL